MRQVYKYEVPTAVGGPVPKAVQLPRGSDVLAAGLVHFPPNRVETVVWMEVRFDTPLVMRRVVAFLTGIIVPDGFEHLASAVGVDQAGQPYVTHVYEGALR